MRRFFIVATVVAVTLAMGMGAVAPIAAQEDTNESDEGVLPGEQGPVSPNGSDDDQEASGGNESTVSAGGDYLQPIDTDTRITDWEYRPGMFTITLKANKTTKVSMTEAGDFEEGTGSFNYKEITVQEGTNTVTMPVTDRQGAGVALATQASLEQGTGAFVSVGQVQKNPFKNFGGETGLFTGVGLSVSLAALGAAYVVRSEDTGVIEA
ncbi:hypothetical protein [Natrinema salinisoli]|uniref:hypothetical protein n=1 Tax=Natrinema salinisoli TaxID=2878535 RepID=UPI001CF07CD8|nr:hypothetical protein [Natrinema salinisoli]